MTWHERVGIGQRDPAARKESAARGITAKRAAGKGGTTSQAARKGAAGTDSGVDESHEHDRPRIPRHPGEINPNLAQAPAGHGLRVAPPLGASAKWGLLPLSVRQPAGETGPTPQQAVATERQQAARSPWPAPPPAIVSRDARRSTR
jgi:hypothetical protein